VLDAGIIEVGVLGDDDSLEGSRQILNSVGVHGGAGDPQVCQTRWKVLSKALFQAFKGSYAE
jgi:hypothetical protein